MGWVQPRENSVASLEHGMLYFDGVELDLRLSSDGELILHHDDSFAAKKYVELHTSEELAPYGDRFSDLIANKKFTDAWQEQAKVVCIELKSPHPSSGVAGGWRAGKARVDHLIEMLDLVEQELAPLNLHPASTVIYSFDPRFLKATKLANTTYPRALLMPYLREWGPTWLKKRIATPSFIANSLPRLMRKHQGWGAPMIPCALDYLNSWTKHLTLGTTVGLKGKHLANLNNIRKGFPLYVWPADPNVEWAISTAGLTGLTDHADPNFHTLPSGQARWPRPSTQPLGGAEDSLSSTPADEHSELLKLLATDLSPWSELSDGERRELLDEWRCRWQWSRTLDELCADASETGMPWEVPRLIGHRGSGRT